MGRQLYMRSFGPAFVSPENHRLQFITLRCVTMAALGSPVVPDVNI